MAKRQWISQEHKIFRQPNGKLYFRGTVTGLGQKEFPLTGATSLTHAIRIKDRKIQDLLKQDAPTPKALIRFEALAEEVMNHKASRAESTMVSAELHLTKHLVPWFNEHCPYVDRINETVWEQYILDQRRLSSTRKLFNDRKHLVCVMLYAYRKGVIPRQLQFRNPDPRTNAGKVYSDVEVERLVSFSNPELRLQILMAATMGMRRGEILSLAWEDIDLEGDVLHIRSEKTKTRIARSIGISPQVLTAFKAIERDGPYLFPSRFDPNKHTTTHKSAWGACKKRARVKGRFHDLRHTFLTNAFHTHKLPVQDVCAYAGLNIIVAQRVYLHPSANQTRDVSRAIRVKLGDSK